MHTPNPPNLKRQINCQRLVVKIGSSLLTADGAGLDEIAIANWAGQIATLITQGIEVVVVSSGAVAEGMVRLHIGKRPTTLSELQACAAIGQMGLVQAWSTALLRHNIASAQVLLSHDELTNRSRYLNIGNTLRQLIEWGVVAVINENDTIATEELRFGDNDTLSAMVAGIAGCDLLVILTDQAGMFNQDPRNNPQAKLLPEVRALDNTLFDMAGSGGSLGRGGMTTKVKAARLAANAGCHTIVASGAEPNVLVRLVAGDNIGTRFSPDQDRLTAKKQWISAHLQTTGSLVLDEGAIKALRHNGASLMPVGVVQVIGQFALGDVVACVNNAGERIAAGIVNFDSALVSQIKQQPSEQISHLTDGITYIIHRDNLVIEPY